MERAPFGWNQPAEREPDELESFARDGDLPLYGDGPIDDEPIDRPTPSGKPAFGQPYIWATSPKPRPRFRYVDDTPKMGRIGGAAFLAFLVLLAFGAVWVIEQDFKGPSPTPQPATQTAALESPQPPEAKPDDSQPNAEAAVPPPAEEKSAPENPGTLEQNAGDPRALREPPPVIGTHEPPATPAEAAPAPRPLERPQANVNARAKTPPAPPAPTQPARRIPFPTSPPLSQQIMRTPAEPAPAPVPPPARVAAAEPPPSPLPRVAVEEPAVTPVTMPPPEPPPAPAAAAASTPPPAAATASAAPPATAASSAAARPPAADVDNSAIRDVLGRYRSAFNRLDAKAAHQVWPTVNERTLDRAFGQLQQQSVSFDRCTIAVKGVMAEANCNGTTRFVPRVGSRSEQIESRQWNFSLRKASSGWQIQEVDAR